MQYIIMTLCYSLDFNEWKIKKIHVFHKHYSKNYKLMALIWGMATTYRVIKGELPRYSWQIQELKEHTHLNLYVTMQNLKQPVSLIFCNLIAGKPLASRT